MDPRDLEFVSALTPVVDALEALGVRYYVAGSVVSSRYGVGRMTADVDIVAEPGLKPYDIVALIPIIEQAGGVVTTFEGGPAEAGGDVIAAATPELHEAAMAALRG